MKNKYLGKSYRTGVGGTITARGRDGNKYIFVCSICSKDEEIWPYGSITANIHHVLKGNFPCGCAKRVAYKPWQYKILVERVCKGRGYTFIGFEGKWLDSKTKLNLFNGATGNHWKSTTIQRLLNGGGDPVEGVAIVKQAITLADEFHINRFMLTGSYKEGSLFRRSLRKGKSGRMHYWYYTCPDCSKDEYSAMGISSGVFETTQKGLTKGLIPCRCSKSYRWTREELEYKIKKLIKQEGHTEFLGWDNNNNTPRSRVLWVCSNGHHCSTRVNGFINMGTRCSTCAQRGFSKHKAGTFYLVRWFGFGNSYLKYGITNRQYTKRIRAQKGTTKLEYEVLSVYFHEDGHIVSDVENKIKSLFNESACPKDLLPDGYTETVEDTLENISIIDNTCKQVLLCLKQVDTSEWKWCNNTNDNKEEK